MTDGNLVFFFLKDAMTSMGEAGVYEKSLGKVYIPHAGPVQYGGIMKENMRCNDRRKTGDGMEI